MAQPKKIILVSSCLAGLLTRYDGKIKTNDICLQDLKNVIWVPVCPEQLGGLATPREAADIVDGTGYDVLEGKSRVLTKSGLDVTAEFITGAQQVLQIAEKQNITTAFLKSSSPSCGYGKRIGVTAALLKKNGIEVIEY